MYSGLLRPKRSSSGPYNNCPADIPMKKLDRDSITCSRVVCSDRAISGNPGKYISMENGPIAVSEPRMRISKK